MAKALVAARLATEVAPPQVVPTTMPRRKVPVRSLDPIAEDDDRDEHLPYCSSETTSKLMVPPPQQLID
ncbi:hypothetical protein PAHAL_1G046600 [Panicum hallii]|jgi:hypothetical protein|uniref:Uncharacterized protein n=1 Tax=Panicum hallii TaxID=206008 RepID=A0A2S3GLW5_9POAL|nr:hypothetical protein PAHAL_1G046600 [Panicum hallii]